jgi:rsbT co-antagonist protein RsbR
LNQLFAIHTEDQELAARGRLLKIVALVLAVVTLLYLPISLSVPGAPEWLPWASVALSLFCLLVFVLAHYGLVSIGGLALGAALIVLVTLAAEPPDLLERPAGLVLLLSILLGAMALGSTGVLLMGAIVVGVRVLSQLSSELPWTAPSVDGLTLLVLASGLLWLLLRMYEQQLAQAREHVAGALAAQTESGAREQTLQQVNKELVNSYDEMKGLLELVRDLETPIIPVLEGVLVLPLVGHLDTRRADQINRAVLEAVYEQRARVVIIDITGISVVDSQIARRIQDLALSVQLLGARVMLTGIKASVAQMLVDLGLNFAGIQTAGRLQDGVAAVLGDMGSWN